MITSFTGCILFYKNHSQVRTRFANDSFRPFHSITFGSKAYTILFPLRHDTRDFKEPMKFVLSLPSTYIFCHSTVEFLLNVKYHFDPC